MIRILRGDCLEILPTLAADSIDACVTDPPYDLAFMGKSWDRTGVAFKPTTWAAIYRVLKPGAHLLSFGGTRTYHRMACAIEDAGFEIRDCVMWVYGSGFPKSHDISKAIDRAAGAEREEGELRTNGRGAWNLKLENHQRGDTGIGHADGSKKIYRETIAATDAARQWQGWGTALKPSHEEIILAQKPYDLSRLCNSMAREIMEVLCQLPSFASAAGSNSTSSLSVFGTDAEHVSAQWNAVLKCNTPADLFALMDMWPSGLAIPSSLSIVLSWLGILDAILSLGNTFTIETRSGLTTDLRTLNSLASTITPSVIIEAATSPNGIGSNASPVAAIFSVVAARLNCIHTLSVAGLVSSTESVGDLLPNCEPIIVARKPLSEKTIAANVQRWGTGALNIDGCRVQHDEACNPIKAQDIDKRGDRIIRQAIRDKDTLALKPNGRWPANLTHDGSEEVTRLFPETESNGCERIRSTGNVYGQHKPTPFEGYYDAGSSARFFYTAKADAGDRLGSKHPTVKPVDLMAYLVRLVTPPGGTVLDPFAGSGTTGMACMRESFDCILIEREPDYVKDIEQRIAHVHGEDTPLFSRPTGEVKNPMWALPFDWGKHEAKG